MVLGLMKNLAKQKIFQSVQLVLIPFLYNMRIRVLYC